MHSCRHPEPPRYLDEHPKKTPAGPSPIGASPGPKTKKTHMPKWASEIAFKTADTPFAKSGTASNTKAVTKSKSPITFGQYRTYVPRPAPLYAKTDPATAGKGHKCIGVQAGLDVEKGSIIGRAPSVQKPSPGAKVPKSPTSTISKQRSESPVSLQPGSSTPTFTIHTAQVETAGPPSILSTSKSDKPEKMPAAELPTSGSERPETVPASSPTTSRSKMPETIPAAAAPTSEYKKPEAIPLGGPSKSESGKPWTKFLKE